MTIDITAIKTLLVLLQGDPLPQVKLQKLVGLSNAPMARWMRTLKGTVSPKGGQRRNSLIYIAEWHKHGKITTPYWTWGHEEVDAPRPPARTNTENGRLFREKQKRNMMTKKSPTEVRL